MAGAPYEAFESPAPRPRSKWHAAMGLGVPAQIPDANKSSHRARTTYQREISGLSEGWLGQRRKGQELITYSDRDSSPLAGPSLQADNTGAFPEQQTARLVVTTFSETPPRANQIRGSLSRPRLII
jgi:hypothetical protein